MNDSNTRLTYVYDGIQGYNRSLISAISGLTPEQLAFRPTPEMYSVGGLATHIANGRVIWYRRMTVPGADELWAEIEARGDKLLDAEQLVDWLTRTWELVERVLAGWTVEDLNVSYPHKFDGELYSVSRQWTIWRIISHDIHHGGQLSMLLALQGIFPQELTYFGGHIIDPPLLP